MINIKFTAAINAITDHIDWCDKNILWHKEQYYDAYHYRWLEDEKLQCIAAIKILKNNELIEE